MRFFGRTALLAVALCLCHCSGPLPVIGFDKHGKVVTYGISEKAYAKTLEKSLGAVQETVAMSAAQSKPRDHWQLQLIAVGVTCRTDFGIGPIRMGVAPAVRAFFTNQDNPPPLP